MAVPEGAEVVGEQRIYDHERHVWLSQPVLRAPGRKDWLHEEVTEHRAGDQERAERERALEHADALTAHHEAVVAAREQGAVADHPAVLGYDAFWRDHIAMLPEPEVDHEAELARLESDAARYRAEHGL